MLLIGLRFRSYSFSAAEFQSETWAALGAAIVGLAGFMTRVLPITVVLAGAADRHRPDAGAAFNSAVVAFAH